MVVTNRHRKNGNLNSEIIREITKDIVKEILTKMRGRQKDSRRRWHHHKNRYNGKSD